MNSNIAVKTVSTNDLDVGLYSPLEGMITAPYQLEFERIYDPTMRRQGVDVILREGPYRSNIAEHPVWSPDAKAIPFELSYVTGNEYAEAGRLLNGMSPTDFFMVHYLEKGDWDELETLVFRALMISRRKLLGILAAIGYDRKVLAVREDLIRKSGRPGIYYTTCSDIWFRFNTTSKFKPIDLVVKTDFLSRMATADIWVRINGTRGEAELAGHWVNKKI